MSTQLEQASTDNLVWDTELEKWRGYEEWLNDKECDADLTPTSFVKADNGKAPLAHIMYFPKTLSEISRVTEYGSRKYNKLNWAKCDDLDRYYSAAMRHLLAYYNGETKDPETGLTHIAHVISNLFFISEIGLTTEEKTL